MYSRGSGANRSTAKRTSPAPPILRTSSPGAAWAASAAATWSALPATTGVPAESPVSRAAPRVTPPTTSWGARTGASQSSSIPAASKRGAIPVAPPGVPEPGLERPVLLEAPLAREPPRDVVVGAEHAPDRAGDGALVAGEPEDLRADELLAERLARRGEEGIIVEPRAERGDLLARAPVVLLDRGAERAVAGAQQHESGHHAAHAHRGHVRQRHVLTHAADARDGIRPPGVGIALGPAGMRRHQIVGGAGAGDDPALPSRAMAFTAVVPMSSPSATFTPSPSTPRPESTFPVLILRRAAAPGQFTSARSAARSRLAQCGRRSALVDRFARGHPARRAPRVRTESMRLVAESIR